MATPFPFPALRAFASIAIVFSLAIAGCNRTPPAPEENRGAAEPVALDVVRVVQQPLNVQLSLPGELAPYQSVAIYPRVAGFVKAVRVDRGSTVRAGELLAELEAPELAARRAEAQSRLEAAQAQLAAATTAAEAQAGTYEKLKAAAATPGVVAGNDLVVAGKAVEGAQSQVAAERQNVEAARQALNAVRDVEAYLWVIAPFDGVITERSVHPGALVGPSSGGTAAPMLRLVDQKRLRLVVPVPEAYTANVTPGATMPFAVAAYPDRMFTGAVARIAQSVDVDTRTMAVELEVVNKDGLLAPGTFCQVRWPVRRSGPSLLVPSGSVASTTDRTFVVRIRDGHTEWVDVKTGLASGPLVEVFGDLRPGDEIAARGTDEMRPGTVVHVKDAKPPAS